MSHQHNVDMHRTRLKTLRSTGHTSWLERRIAEEQERLESIQATIAQLEYERDHIPELIEQEEKALRRALRVKKHHDHQAKIEKLLRLQAEINRTQEEINNATEDA